MWHLKIKILYLSFVLDINILCFQLVSIIESQKENAHKGGPAINFQVKIFLKLIAKILYR